MCRHAMLKRLENYIHDPMIQMHRQYPVNGNDTGIIVYEKHEKSISFKPIHPPIPHYLLLDIGSEDSMCWGL